jgi:acetoin utilization deacetylase AcuC-like enzyme
MRVLLYSHPVCLLHDNGPGHPERPERIGAALAGVRSSGLEVVEREAPPAPVEALYPVHHPEYVERIEAACALGGRMLDPDTAVVAGSWEAALRAAGSGLAAIDDLRRGDGDMAFLAVRPPGHHAGPSQARGFCIFNNIAISAAALVAAGESVAILDWDVHHGDGTQQTFYDSADVLYLTVHQFPFYPGSGWIEETGQGAGSGLTVNVALPAGAAGDVLSDAVDEIFEPVLRDFAPDWLLVSAGYDGHRADPLAELRFESDDFGWVAERLVSGYRGRAIVFLEGGYDLEAISESSSTTVRGIGGESFSRPTGSSSAPAHEMVRRARQVAGRHWSIVQGG